MKHPAEIMMDEAKKTGDGETYAAALQWLNAYRSRATLPERIELMRNAIAKAKKNNHPEIIGNTVAQSLTI